MKPFVLSSIPKTFFGCGTLSKVNEIISQESCRNILLLTGGNSFIRSAHYTSLIENLKKSGVNVEQARVNREPSPELVDDITALAREKAIDMVISVGGGSVLDAGKAVSAMIKLSGTVKDYLEGVGTKNHCGSKVPFVAVPTTSGTGSEATKNAVLSNVGKNGFKKSLRHDNFVPDFAILDAELSLTCPPLITAASGMDALNQLIEGYLSVKANSFTDSLAISGIYKILQSLEPVCLERPDDRELRGNMSYAAYLSGIVLANAGLGYVHGFAGVIGGMADIPHGVVCGKLNAGVFEAVANHIRGDKDNKGESYEKLIKLTGLLPFDCKSDDCKIGKFIERMYTMEEKLKLPSFSSYKLDVDDIIRAVEKTSGKESPVTINSDNLFEIIKKIK